MRAASPPLRFPFPGGVFEIQFDFVDHRLEIWTSTGERRELRLKPMTVADFYFWVIEALRSVGVAASINTKPQEMDVTTPFDKDTEHASYDADAVRRFFQVLVSSHTVMEEFRGKFVGKSSPVHFFWGSFDLAVTRFCGKPAPPRPGVITGPAYSHEEISAGFWPGGGFDGPAFYAYSAPAPPGLENEAIRPPAAGWNTKLREFILMYDDVRLAASPRDALMQFLESTYDAGARLSHWDRAALEMKGDPV